MGDERTSPYATPSATREVLERHGLYTKYALGQNFLVNDDVVRKIIELAEVGEGDHVLEVGPGIGTLTAALAAFFADCCEMVTGEKPQNVYAAMDRALAAQPEPLK